MIPGILLLIAAAMGVLYWLPFVGIAFFIYICYIGSIERWDSAATIMTITVILLMIGMVS